MNWWSESYGIAVLVLIFSAVFMAMALPGGDTGMTWGQAWEVVQSVATVGALAVCLLRVRQGNKPR